MKWILVLVVTTLIATFAFTTQSKSATTMEGAAHAIAVIDWQLAEAGVDASFEEALGIPDPPVMDLLADCRTQGGTQFGEITWNHCITEGAPPDCAGCLSTCKTKCIGAWFDPNCSWEFDDLVDCAQACQDGCDNNGNCGPFDCGSIPAQPSG